MIVVITTKEGVVEQFLKCSYCVIYTYSTVLQYYQDAITIVTCFSTITIVLEFY